MAARTEEAVREEFINVNGVETSVLKLGKLRSREEGAEQRFLMLIVPGNPGLPHFYDDFMQELFAHCDGQFPVWAVGHAGHVQPPGQHLQLSHVYSTPKETFGLEAQITHKIAFIQENIPPDVKLLLIGHSIGCYMILNMLEQLPDDKVLHGFLLFPTIERMASSPAGVKMTPLLRYLRWVVVLLAFFLSFIPRMLQSKLVDLFLRSKDQPECMKAAVLQTVTPWTANFTTFLAKLEMNQVTALQKDIVRKHLSKLSFYYGSKDHWAPQQYFHDLVSTFPEADARLCELNLKHAFVTETAEGRQMAKLVWTWARSHHHTVLSRSGSNKTWVFDE